MSLMTGTVHTHKVNSGKKRVFHKVSKSIVAKNTKTIARRSAFLHPWTKSQDRSSKSGRAELSHKARPKQFGARLKINSIDYE